METKTEAPELTQDLIYKAQTRDQYGPFVVIGALTAVALHGAQPSEAARVLTRYAETGVL